MKIISIIILCFCFNCYSQQTVDNKSHPFQVLFVDSSFYLGEETSIDQFDFIGNYDLIRNYGELVLLHYSGIVLEFKHGIVDINLESSRLKKDTRFYVRPLLIHSQKYQLSAEYLKTSNIYANANCLMKSLEILYPFYENDVLPRRRSNSLPIYWRYLDEASTDDRFGFQVRNIYDEVLIQKERVETGINLDLTHLNLSDGLMICSINHQVMDHEIGLYVDKTEDRFHVIFKEDQTSSKHYLLTKYFLIVDAIMAEVKEMYILADQLYTMAIEDSDNDPRFLKLYEQFLKRHATSKSTVAE